MIRPNHIQTHGEVDNQLSFLPKFSLSEEHSACPTLLKDYIQMGFLDHLPDCFGAYSPKKKRMPKQVISNFCSIVLYCVSLLTCISVSNLNLILFVYVIRQLISGWKWTVKAVSEKFLMQWKTWKVCVYEALLIIINFLQYISVGKLAISTTNLSALRRFEKPVLPIPWLVNKSSINQELLLLLYIWDPTNLSCMYS